MAKAGIVSKISSLALPELIEAEVLGWRKQGYHPFPRVVAHNGKNEHRCR